MKWFLLFFFSSLVVFLTTVYFRLGGYKEPTIEIIESSELFFVGKNHTGAYHKINAIISEVETWAVSQRIPCTVTYGEYFDDPRTKDEDRLQSRGGCLLERPLAKDILLPEGYAAHTKKSGPYVKATFEGAPSIGPFKVYPAVENFFEQNKFKMAGSVVEVYKIYGKDKATTEYYFEFAK